LLCSALSSAFMRSCYQRARLGESWTLCVCADELYDVLARSCPLRRHGLTPHEMMLYVNLACCIILLPYLVLYSPRPPEGPRPCQCNAAPSAARNALTLSTPTTAEQRSYEHSRAHASAHVRASHNTARMQSCRYHTLGISDVLLSVGLEASTGQVRSSVHVSLHRIAHARTRPQP
jgi:hypothetical protein